jgi:hypothetical protein
MLLSQPTVSCPLYGPGIAQTVPFGTPIDAVVLIAARSHVETDGADRIDTVRTGRDTLSQHQIIPTLVATLVHTCGEHQHQSGSV